MNTIVIIAHKEDWKAAQKSGKYEQSTIDSTLAEVGFIHCSFPDQTMEIANRRFADRDNLVLLLIDESKVKSPVEHEGALSGRAGTFPHIYGPLNVDAVYKTLLLNKNADGNFETPEELKPLAEQANDAVAIAPDLHKVIFENDKIRVLKVTVPPKARAAMHWHPENINYILAPGKLKFTKPDGSIAEIELTEGQLTSSPSASSHEVENVGDTEVQTIQVEMKQQYATN